MIPQRNLALLSNRLAQDGGRRLGGGTANELAPGEAPRTKRRELAGVVYVLHCFQKKSKKGIATPKSTIDLIHQRLRAAEAMHKKRGERP